MAYNYNLRQMRGVTGIAPKRDYNAENYAKAQTLPAEKAYQYNKDATERSLALTEQGLNDQKDYYDSLDADRKRGMWLQGGMLGVSGLNAINDATGGDLLENVSSGISNIFDGGAGDISNNVGVGNFSDPSNIPGSSFLSDAAGAVGDYIIDPIVEGAGAIKDWAADAVSGAGDWLDSLFS
jgi:hypothetical protein